MVSDSLRLLTDRLPYSGVSSFFIAVVRSDRNFGSLDIRCCCKMEVLRRVVDLVAHHAVYKQATFLRSDLGESYSPARGVPPS